MVDSTELRTKPRLVKEDDSQPARHSQRDEAAVRVVPETSPRAVRQVQSDVLLVSVSTRCAPGALCLEH